ncbi:MAG: hypothetical protein ACLRZ7_00315 [Lachnospiraceae bacterium]
MNIIGEKVTHIKYGNGTIAAICDNKLKVDFGAAVKTFLYPDSFEKYFSIPDKNVENFINTKLEKVDRMRELEREKVVNEWKGKEYLRKLKVKQNSQAVFAMNENNLEDVMGNWTVSTGKYKSGNNHGKPRVPRSLNMNSACLLTLKAEGSTEANRIIAGIFMTTEDFIGLKCDTGIIHAHENYRIIWQPDEEELFFWNYFPEDNRLARWGSSEMKYISNLVIKKILDDMIRLTLDSDRKKEIEDFYDYFCQINHL